jgi:S1-C subfamily serine protease
MQSTGFAFAPQHVMALASDVAGSANGGLHVIDAHGMSHAATIVLFDPTLDIAVLDVPTLSVPALGFASTFVPWSRVAIVGYVLDGARPTVTTASAEAASDVITRGIYGGSDNLQFILIHGSDASGESGSPVLDRSGQVDGIVDGYRGSPPQTFALSQLEVQSDVAAGEDRTIAAANQKCVGNGR